MLGVVLKRIHATVEFTLKCGIKVKAGENGGWIEKEENLSGNAWVSGDARVYGNACVSGNARVSGNACVYGNACVSGNARMYDDAWVSGDACVSGHARMYDDACVSGNARVYGNARVSGDACVSGDAHYFQIGPAGSRNDYTTFMRDKQGIIYVSCGCFYGTINEFREKVKRTHGDNKHAKVYLAAADLAELQIDTTPIDE